MSRSRREATPTDPPIETAVLVHVSTPQEDRRGEEALKELQTLAESAGVTVVDAIHQRRRTPHPGTYVGKGRLEELVSLCQECDAQVVIFGHDLSPAQGRNLEKELELRVVDRSQLIMDLFALRARTSQARLQVELAQLQYSLPRLRRLWTHLDRYKGGGVGMRGPGETQLESDRREIGRKIVDRRRKLEALERQHELHRASRGDRFTVGLVGYTNAGKSTLFNRLTAADVAAENRPFSTLDTRTKAWKVERGCEVLLSDTVGFVHQLPHHLIASFHATLAEALEADLLLHVVDGSHSECLPRIQSVESVLAQIGADQRPRLLLVNKVDAMEDRAMLGQLSPDAIPISARDGDGVDELRSALLNHYRQRFQELHLAVPVVQGAVLAAVAANGQVLEKVSVNGAIHFQVRLPPRLAGQFRDYVDPGPMPVAD